MFRMWAKIWKENRMLKDMVACDDREDVNRTKKVFDSIDKVCIEFDLSRPIWLESNIVDFKKRDKVRFNKDNFIDDIEFDYLEIHVIEE